MDKESEGFDERAQQVLAYANEEAQRFNHNYIGTEHLLLGLLRVEDGVASMILGNLGIDLSKVRSAVEFIIGRGERQVVGHIGLTPRAKKVVNLSRDESRRLGHTYVGTEHILLGLIREGEGIAAGVLESLGVNLEKARREVIVVITGGTSPTTRQRLSSPAQSSGQTHTSHWEYLVVPAVAHESDMVAEPFFNPMIDLPDLAGMRIERGLSLLGDLGWELAAIDSRHHSAQGVGSLYILKRPK